MSGDVEAGASVAIAEIEAFRRISSVSAGPADREGIAAAAARVAGRLDRAGFDAIEVLPLDRWTTPPFEPVIHDDRRSRAACRTTRVRC